MTRSQIIGQLREHHISFRVALLGLQGLVTATADPDEKQKLWREMAFVAQLHRSMTQPLWAEVAELDCADFGLLGIVQVTHFFTKRAALTARHFAEREKDEQQIRMG